MTKLLTLRAVNKGARSLIYPNKWQELEPSAQAVRVLGWLVQQILLKVYFTYVCMCICVCVHVHMADTRGNTYLYLCTEATGV